MFIACLDVSLVMQACRVKHYHFLESFSEENKYTCMQGILEKGEGWTLLPLTQSSLLLLLLFLLNRMFDGLCLSAKQMRAESSFLESYLRWDKVISSPLLILLASLTLIYCAIPLLKEFIKHGEKASVINKSALRLSKKLFIFTFCHNLRLNEMWEMCVCLERGP